jgi:hypothetical protein
VKLIVQPDAHDVVGEMGLKSHVLVGVLGPIGVVFSLLVGITLMTLLFYSSRHGYDEFDRPPYCGAQFPPCSD